MGLSDFCLPGKGCGTLDLQFSAWSLCWCRVEIQHRELSRIFAV